MSWISRGFPTEYLDAFQARAAPGAAGVCWLWPEGHRARAGYGLFSVNGVQASAHRLSYAVHHGDPGFLLVRHRCDTPPCWNPEHLLLGTDKDNHDDCVERDRTRFGVKHPGAKLTDEAARRIFLEHHSGKSMHRLAAEHGVTVSVVYRIAHRTGWRRATKDLDVQELSRAERTLRGENHPMAKLSQRDVADIRALLRDGVPRQQIATRYSVGLTTIGRINDGVRR